MSLIKMKKDLLGCQTELTMERMKIITKEEELEALKKELEEMKKELEDIIKEWF